jgi:glycosyltransferase involved in cell wall biosynthesis
MYLQTDSNEWNYENIIYSNNYRENLNYNEILDFIYKYKIKKIIIIEATFLNIFNISLFLKSLNIKIYIVVNIECIRLVELTYHNIFDRILTNNIESQSIMSTLFENKAKYLGFHLNHYYFKNINKISKENTNYIKFCCIGGLNSLSRKNIDIVIKSFYNIYNENKYLNWELNVYIQGVEIPEIVNNYKSSKINYYINELSYKNIIDKYIENDIFIHMGSHEGLGLGFYESLYCGTPILTMNWIPNNEIITNNINGWLLNCDYSNIYDNDNSLINQGIINEESLKIKIIEILNSNNTINIINNTIKNKDILINKNKYNFEKNLIDILLE